MPLLKLAIGEFWLDWSGQHMFGMVVFDNNSCGIFRRRAFVPYRMEMRETAKIALKKYDTGDLFSFLPAMPKASVLIPVFVRGGELHVLMTLRSPHVSIILMPVYPLHYSVLH